MKSVILALGASLVAAGWTTRTETPEAARLKDRAAMMIYDGRDRVIALIPQADSANLALILLQQWEGELVPKAQLSDRSCVGVALFSKAEWAAFLGRGLKPADVRPSQASLRLRLYPASGDRPPAVQNVQTDSARVALGLQRHATWSLRTYVDAAKGPCMVE